MTLDQLIVLLLLAATVVSFVWGRWRHDMVAVAALLGCVAAGLVPAADAFAGFGHPAVITVACVLVLSRAVQLSGAVDAIASRVIPSGAGPTAAIAALTLIAALLSGFVNNVGALALLLPLGLQVAGKHDIPPGQVLMPLAFGSILGGMTTMIGTPPNLIVSGFRAQSGDSGFGMFDFTPVGAAIAIAGVAFVVVAGRWLVPARSRTTGDDFDTAAYLTEVRIGEKNKLAGRPFGEVEAEIEELDAQLVGLIRRDVRVPAPNPTQRLLGNDILVIEAEPEALAATLSRLGLKLEEDVRAAAPLEEKATDADDTAVANPAPARAGIEIAARPADAEEAAERDEEAEEQNKSSGPDEIVLGEFVVMPDSTLAGRSATDIQLRTRFGINLLAISRQGRRSLARLRTMPFRPGDVLLLQGTPAGLAGFANGFGCIPLAARSLRIPDSRRAVSVAIIMLVAIAGAALGLVPAAIGFASGALAVMVLRLMPARELYESIDWPVIVLLGALIPVAGAVATTGTADMLARLLLDVVAQGHPVVALALILIVTMTLSDFMNNAATAAVMCPIAIGTASRLGLASDPFLMAVAVGASCAFLTPIGHQNNTLILGPGGFRFGDYWRLGLPLEVLVVAVAVPMILWVWPL